MISYTPKIHEMINISNNLQQSCMCHNFETSSVHKLAKCTFCSITYTQSFRCSFPKYSERLLVVTKILR